MMDVQVMRQIVDVVEQGAMPIVVQDAAARWGGRAAVESLTYVRSGYNFIFRFLQASEPRFLRLTPTARRDRAAIEAEVAFIQHVANAGLAVALPVPSERGALVEEMATGDERYLAVVFAGLHGDQFEVDDLDEARFHAWGRALAVLHRASETFPPHPARPHWADEVRESLRAFPPEETTIAQVLTSGLTWLEALPLDARDYGLIHGDFELDNLVWDGGRAQALDFDDAMYAPYALDLAIALQDVFALDDPQREQRIAWFTEGYAEVRLLPPNFRETMPRFLALLSAVKVARMLQAYATTPQTGNPAWVEEMRGYHQQWFARQRETLVWP